MKWRRFALASAVLALLVAAGWWGQVQRNRAAAWALVHKALEFHRRWVAGGAVQWSVRLPDGRWLTQTAQISLTRRALQVRAAGVDLICQLPECRVAVRAPSQLHVAAEEANQLLNAARRWALLRCNYRAELAGTISVAGRFCQLVRLIPRRREAFERRFAIDPETGMILRQEVIDRDGTVLSSVQWRKVQEQRRQPHPAVAASQRVTRLPRWAATLPYGFVVAQVLRSRCTCCPCGMAAQVIHATDGAADVAIYLLEHPQRQRGCPYCRLPRRTPYYTRIGALTTVAVGEPQPIVVIGDAPAHTLMAIADIVLRKGR